MRGGVRKLSCAASARSTTPWTLRPGKRPLRLGKRPLRPGRRLLRPGRLVPTAALAGTAGGRGGGIPLHRGAGS